MTTSGDTSPSLPSPMATTPQPSDEEYQHHLNTILRLYATEAKNYENYDHKQTLLRKISGPGYTVDGIEDTRDWINMWLSDSRNMFSAPVEKIPFIIENRALFAIHYHMHYVPKMPEYIFKKYINLIWQLMNSNH